MGKKMDVIREESCVDSPRPASAEGPAQLFFRWLRIHMYMADDIVNTFGSRKRGAFPKLTVGR